jgi:hypothetical protein
MSRSIRLEPIPASEAFDTTDYAPTFASSGFRACRLHGPASLVRLVHGERYSILASNAYWIEAAVFQKFLAEARSEIARQGDAPPAHLVGLHMRFQLRDALAVSRDWSDLDHYIELHLPPGQALVALVGQAAGQPYYSVRQSADHARAEAANIRLPGGGEQIVIDFKHPSNRDAVRFVSGTIPF